LAKGVLKRNNGNCVLLTGFVEYGIRPLAIDKIYSVQPDFSEVYGVD
jgi:hypothetical protein